jgi:glutamate/tyrosine decarboxylase-like PLP-dependent enzyme
MVDDTEDLLRRTSEHALTFLRSARERHVGARATVEDLRRDFRAAGLSEAGEDPRAVLDALVAAAEPGLIASAGPRYFGFVIGGSFPVAVAADWMTSAWDQNGFAYSTSPAAAVAEEVAASWLLDLLGLPASAGVGFTSGATMASFTGLAAARRAVLQRVGWDVDDRGLIGAPELSVVASEESHVTIFAALGLLGLGRGRVKKVRADAQGRMIADDLRAVLAGCHGPTIVCAQAGNVNTGAFDPLEAIAALTRAHGAWLHVDGAFGLWAAASPERRHLTQGAAAADSWTLDAHKWLNVPYGSGIAVVADREAHHHAMTLGAAYYIQTDGRERDNYDWVPDSSRRALGFTVYAALRSLGRRGVAALVERNCAQARRMAEQLAKTPGVEVLNDVVLNQVLVRFDDDDARTGQVIARVQADGTCWLSGTRWHERAAMRISFSNWSTTDADVDRSAEAIRRALFEVRAAR